MTDFSDPKIRLEKALINLRSEKEMADEMVVSIFRMMLAGARHQRSVPRK